MISKKYGFLFLIVLLLAGCSIDGKDDPKPDPEPEPEPTVSAENKWILETMRKNYLWYKEIPADSRLDLSSESDALFYSLLSKSDGKIRKNSNGESYHAPYSYIEKKSKSVSKSIDYEDNTYGFELIYTYLDQNRTTYAIIVLFVLPGSPADESGLERGDIILTVNGKAVSYTDSEINALLSPSASASLTLEVAKRPDFNKLKEIKLTAKNHVTDNPVFTYKTIPFEGKNIGYLLYNHFTADPEDNGQKERFNDSMRAAFAEMAKDNLPDEFILDLRYNGGGLVTCAQLLATMLVPASNLDGKTVFCNLIDNQEKSYPIYFDPKLIKVGTYGANLNLSRLYVIVSDRTASASEAVINGLLPHMDVIILGEQTEGKNVGSVAYEDNKYDWILHPIVSRISNSKNEGDYADGFSPDVYCHEYEDMIEYDLGDEREYLLKGTLNYITTGVFPKTKISSLRSSGLDMKPLYNSLDRKKMSSVILPADYISH